MLPDQCYCKYVGTFDMWHLVITATLDGNNVVFICEDRPPHLTLVHFVQIFSRNSRKCKHKKGNECKWSDKYYYVYGVTAFPEDIKHIMS